MLLRKKKTCFGGPTSLKSVYCSFYRCLRLNLPGSIHCPVAHLRCPCGIFSFAFAYHFRPSSLLSPLTSWCTSFPIISAFCLPSCRVLESCCLMMFGVTVFGRQSTVGAVPYSRFLRDLHSKSDSVSRRAHGWIRLPSRASPHGIHCRRCIQLSASGFISVLVSLCLQVHT